MYASRGDGDLDGDGMYASRWRQAIVDSGLTIRGGSAVHMINEIE